MVKYQADKPELLINTDWGIPINDLAATEAKARGLVNLNDRWTTVEDKRRLKREHLVYSWVHLTILLTTLGGVVTGLVGLTTLMSKPGFEAKLEGGITLYLGIFALVVAHQLRQYQPFGRSCAMVLGILNILSAVVVFLDQGVNGWSVLWHVLWLIAIARLFYSPIGNVIFSPAEKPGPVPVEEAA